MLAPSNFSRDQSNRSVTTTTNLQFICRDSISILLYFHHSHRQTKKKHRIKLKKEYMKHMDIII